jgi:hypothetical protein
MGKPSEDHQLRIMIFAREWYISKKRVIAAPDLMKQFPI